MKRSYFMMISVLFLGTISLLFATGCNLLYTGGGTLDSENCENGEKAVFGFVVNSCEEEDKGVFNYHDLAAEDGPVKMQGKLITVIYNLLGQPQYALVSYRSTEPTNRGNGTAGISFADYGEGNPEEGAHGQFQIWVIDGPFAGYANSGDISGNIQEHECDEY